MQVRHLVFEPIEDGLHGPDEDARIPAEVPRSEELLGQLAVGLLGEGPHLPQPVVSCIGQVFVLDVAVPGVRPRRCDAEREQLVGLRRPVHGHGEHVAEPGLIRNQVVSGCDDHGRLRIPLDDALGSIGEARSGVAHEGLAEDLVLRDARELVEDVRLVPGVGHHVHAVGRHHGLEPVRRHLDEGPPAVQDVQELLRATRTAHRPEAGADAAGHDDGVGVVVLGHVASVWGFTGRKGSPSCEGRASPKEGQVLHFGFFLRLGR